MTKRRTEGRITSNPDAAKLDLTTPIDGHVPTPFGAERAKQIMATILSLAGDKGRPLTDAFDAAMTPGENAYVWAVRRTILHGEAQWIWAFWAIEHGFKPRPGGLP